MRSLALCSAVGGGLCLKPICTDLVGCDVTGPAANLRFPWPTFGPLKGSLMLVAAGRDGCQAIVIEDSCCHNGVVGDFNTVSSIWICHSIAFCLGCSLFQMSMLSRI